MANGTLVGAIRVEASLDAGKFVDGAKKVRQESKQTEATVKQSFSGMGNSIKAGIASFVGALSVGMFTTAIKAALDYASGLKTVSAQLGTTTKDLQELRYAAGQSGIGPQQLDQALQQLNTTLGKAAAGSKPAIAAFNSVGVSLEDIRKKSNRQIFEQIADGMLKQGGAAKNAAAANTIFGESAGKLAPLLDRGSAGVNELAAAANELGIVLSDEQIENADVTAKKLEAIKTVLGAKIAHIVADNANAILAFADAFTTLADNAGREINSIIGKLEELRGFLAMLATNYSLPALIDPASQIPGTATAIGQVGRSVSMKLPSVKSAPGGRPPAFLAKSGGGRKPGRGRAGPRDRSDDVAAQVAREMLQADMDILRAKQQLAPTYIEQASLAIAMLDLERQMFQLEQSDKVRRAQRDFAEKKIDKATLDQVLAADAAARAKYDEVDALKRQAVLAEEQAQREADVRRLEGVSLDLQEDALRDQLALATTAKERRELELRLLDLARQREQAAIDELAASKDIADQEEARRRQIALNGSYGSQRQAVMNGTRGPLEQWASTVPKTAEEITEAFQQIQAQGLENLSSALTDVIMGTRDLKDAFRALAADIIAQTIQMIIKMLIFRALTQAFGGGTFGGAGVPIPSGGGTPGFASGGSFMIGGRGGVDRNVLSLNGLPIARVSKGETVGISTNGFDAGSMPPSVSLAISNDFRGADPAAIAAIMARQDRFEAELPSRVVNVWEDARSRFVIRGR